MTEKDPHYRKHGKGRKLLHQETKIRNSGDVQAIEGPHPKRENLNIESSEVIHNSQQQLSRNMPIEKGLHD